MIEQEEQILFSEVQRFRAWWLWILLALLAVSIIYPVFSNHEYVEDIWIPAIIISLIIAFFLITKMETKVTDKAIYYRFLPLILKWRKIESAQIESAAIRRYAPIMEYGGWGLRYGWGSKGSAVNVSGNLGLQLQFKVGRPLLIGTCEPEALQCAVDAMLRTA